MNETELLTEEERQEIQLRLNQEIQEYEMPQVEIGTPVIWYTTGVPSRRRCQLAFVYHAGQRNVGIYTSRGQRIEAVRHITDPKLRLSADQRESGAWDFTEAYLMHKRTIEDLQKRVAALEGEKEAATSNMQEILDLRKKCYELGIKTSSKWKIADYRAAIAQIEKLVEETNRK